MPRQPCSAANTHSMIILVVINILVIGVDWMLVARVKKSGEILMAMMMSTLGGWGVRVAGGDSSSLMAA